MIDKKIFIEVGNNKGQPSDQETDVSGGIGLLNLKNRLQLLYGDQYELKIEENGHSYFTFLTLNQNMDV
jgi:LytS/YehU family sensor histidine kinase